MDGHGDDEERLGAVAPAAAATATLGVHNQMYAPIRDDHFHADDVVADELLRPSLQSVGAARVVSPAGPYDSARSVSDAHSPLRARLLRPSVRTLLPPGVSHTKQLYCTCCCAPLVCTRRWTCCVVSLFVTLFTLVVIFVLAWRVVAPPYVQRFVDGAQMQCTRIGMQTPHGMSFQLAATCNIAHGNIGGVVGYIEPTVFAVTYGDDEFGALQSVRTELSGATESAFDMTAPVAVTDFAVFNAFSSAMMHQPNVTMSMRGSVTLTAMAGGFLPVPFTGIHFAKSITLPGLDGLSEMNVTALSVRVDPLTNYVYIVTDMVLHNPSFVYIDPLGDVTLELSYADSHIGRLFAPDVVILPGVNVYSGWSGRVQPDNITVLNAMLTTFLAGQPLTISAHGARVNASSLPLYAPFLANTTLTASYTGPDFELGLQVRAYIPDIDELIYALIVYHTVGFPVRVLFHNPFAAAINITRLDLTVWYEGMEIGYAHENVSTTLTPLNIYVGQNVTQFSDEVMVYVYVNPHAPLEALIATIDLLRHGAIPLGLRGRLDLRLGELLVTPYYFQKEDIPTCTFFWLNVCNNMTRTQWPFVDPAALGPQLAAHQTLLPLHTTAAPASNSAADIAAAPPPSLAVSTDASEWSARVRAHPYRLRDGSPAPKRPASWAPPAWLHELRATRDRDRARRT